MEDLRYPVGKFKFPESVSAAELAAFVDQIEQTPARVRAAVGGLADSQLDTPYRPGGWTVRQLAHHIPDSHMNSYVRFRFALTEDTPVIKPYEESRWAELADARTMPVQPSLALLESLHARWVPLLRSLTDADWKRSFRHPELGPVSLEQTPRSMPGTAAITWRTSPRCAAAWGGENDGLVARSVPTPRRTPRARNLPTPRSLPYPRTAETAS